ncbi:ROK family glucokinase [Oceanobacillus sp. Castelsardo]|uniref:ROK family glucokinase n=1 Tax=Oceanobacillus sp. Castelsardo TaxID=1851204 RepID=UPI0008380963|nr:ROK family glucokinase [Oceanobacillus sp. Castelsardo]
MEKILVGVDIGGTTIKLGFINLNGTIIEKWEIPTNTTNNGNAIVDDIWKSIQNKLDNQKNNIGLYGIGVGAPGFINVESGYVSEAVNIGWKGMDLKHQLEKRSTIPVFVQNDANIAALGEYWIGAGQGSLNMIAVTLGTGVGGGIIVNGSILNGENGMAGEIGHIKVDPEGVQCNCGGTGCLETISSATGIKRQGMNSILINPNSKLAKYYEDKGVITAKDVIDFAKTGDETCLKIVDYSCDILGKVLANIGTVINPSKVIIGGGVSKAGDFLLEKIDTAFRKYAIPKLHEICELKIAQLGNDAGILGGAFLVKQNLEEQKIQLK